MGISPFFQTRPSYDELVEDNTRLLAKVQHLEHGIMQEYVDLTQKVIEGFAEMVVHASNGNAHAREKVELFLDALRMAQGKPVKLPRLIKTPHGEMVVEAENKSNVLDDEILQEGEDT